MYIRKVNLSQRIRLYFSELHYIRIAISTNKLVIRNIVKVK